jgi:ribonuclease VapC
MILDTSALVAILFEEPEADRFIHAILRAEVRRISAATFVELFAVVQRQAKPEAERRCDAFLRRAEIVVEPVTVEQAYLAREAFHDFGKGRHPAGLNFGDCFAWALARATGEPLLFKGSAFSRTGIPAAAF